MKIDEAEIKQAIEVGKMVRKGAAGQMDKLIEELAGAAQSDSTGCNG